MRILFFLLFPIFLSAQINRAYGVIELGPTFPASSATTLPINTDTPSLLGKNKRNLI